MTTRIIVDGIALEVALTTLSYEDIERIALRVDPLVTYRVKSTGAVGELSRGDVLAVSEDLVINTERTA